MNLILFDNQYRAQLLPLTFTRPQAHIRIGILTVAEKWERLLGVTASYLTQPYLSGKYKVTYKKQNLFVAGSFCPVPETLKQLQDLKPGEALRSGDDIVAFCGDKALWLDYCNDGASVFNKSFIINGDLINVTRVYDIFMNNDAALRLDFAELIKDGGSWALSNTVNVIGDIYQNDGTPNIFLEEGAVVEYATINLTKGPVYIGKNAEIMEGASIRGSLAMLNDSKINMGAKIYGSTTLGPHVKVGGEVNNSVIFGYSNKGHDGFLGNAVIGEWCNLGADTNNSNLKNDYSNVRVWNYSSNSFERTNMQFCGLIMGDHSKAGINTMFNTATVVGVGANIYGSGFPRTFLPSYIMGGREGMKANSVKSVSSMAKRMMERRGIEFTEHDEAIFEYIYNETEVYRKGI